MARIFLIHGYVEDATIFDSLVPLLPAAEFVGINLADEFARWQPTDALNARLLAQYLTNQYGIRAEDVIIGHSMGGWVAINIKQLTGSRAIQLAPLRISGKLIFRRKT